MAHRGKTQLSFCSETQQSFGEHNNVFITQRNFLIHNNLFQNTINFFDTQAQTNTQQNYVKHNKISKLVTNPDTESDRNLGLAPVKLKGAIFVPFMVDLI